VEGEKGTAESRRLATDLFLPSFAVFVGVDGVQVMLLALRGTACGRARKNLWEEELDLSSMLTTTAAAPAVYAKIREDERLSKDVGDETVVPIMRLRERPDS